MKKLAPNQSEQREIRKLVAEDRSPEEIANKLQIHLPAVENWVDHWKKEAVKADKMAKEAAEAAEKAKAEAAAAEKAAMREELLKELEAEGMLKAQVKK